MRLRGFDYSTPGAYFVTMCTRHCEPAFGAVRAGRMMLNDAGRIADAAWSDLPRHYPHVDLDAWVVMPDHVHGVIVLTHRVDRADTDDNAAEWWECHAARRGGFERPYHVDGGAFEPRPCVDGGGFEPRPCVDGGALTIVHAIDATADEATQPGRRHALPEIVRAFKTFSARRINAGRETPGRPLWQRGYYEHVVRGPGSLARIRAYIQANPAAWTAEHGP